MNANQKVALDILNTIERARSGNVDLDELERQVWRLLESADAAFPRRLSGRLKDFVQELRQLRRENLSFFGGRDTDPDRGADVLFNEVTGELGRFLD